MSIHIHAKFSRPAQLLGGSPKAGLANLVFSSLAFPLLAMLVGLSAMLLSLALLILLQGLIFYLSLKNPFFVEELIYAFDSYDGKAVTHKGVQSYV